MHNMPGARPTRRQWKKAKTLPRNFRRVNRIPYRKPTVKRIVKQVLARRVETKLKTYTWASDAHIHGGGLSLDTFDPSLANGFLLPALSSLLTLPQGFTQQTRIGNSITPKGLTVSGLITSMPWQETTNQSLLPFEVHMIMYRSRRDPDHGPPNYLKQLNAGVVGPISGTALNDMAPYNKEGYVILKRRVWRLKPSPAYDLINTTAGQQLEQVNPSFGSTSNKYFHRFKLRIPLPKKLMYQDPGITALPDEELNPPGNMEHVGDFVATAPTNFRASLGFYIVNGDGNALPQNQVRSKVDLKAALYYTDE